MSPDAAPPRDYVHRTGAPPGFKGRHLVIGVVVFVVWFSVMGFVLTHGRDQSSSVDVYSQLPSGFTAGLATKGVTYQGLSPVAPGVQSAALAHVASSANDNGGKPLVYRTAFSVSQGAAAPGTPTSALMVVVPDPQGTDVRVDFLDPTSYTTLKSVEYGG